MEPVGAKQAVVMLSVMFLGIITAYRLLRNGFFRLPPRSKASDPSVGAGQVLGMFLIYLTLVILIIPAVVIYGLKYDPKEIEDFYIQGLLQTVSVWCSFLGVFATYFIFRPAPPQSVWNREKPDLTSVSTHFSLGVLLLPLGYAIVVLLTSLAGWTVEQFVEIPKDVHQVAVNYFRRSLPYPWLLGLSAASIIVLVPIQEEILFRGFLQSWLRGYLGSKGAIVVASLIFAFFHFSTLQGVLNIPLLISLFFLSLLLGFLYERQGSLWASIGLHTSFNALSIALIAFAG